MGSPLRPAAFAAGMGSPSLHSSHGSPRSSALRSVRSSLLSSSRPGPLPRAPVKVLDAPGLLDDFYLQLLDWGIGEDAVAAALGSVVYLWKARGATVQELCDAGEGKSVCALRWRPSGAGASHGGAGGSSRLAVGLSDGHVQLWDPERGR